MSVTESKGPAKPGEGATPNETQSGSSLDSTGNPPNDPSKLQSHETTNGKSAPNNAQRQKTEEGATSINGTQPKSIPESTTNTPNDLSKLQSHENNTVESEQNNGLEPNAEETRPPGTSQEVTEDTEQLTPKLEDRALQDQAHTEPGKPVVLPKPSEAQQRTEAGTSNVKPGTPARPPPPSTLPSQTTKGKGAAMSQNQINRPLHPPPPPPSPSQAQQNTSKGEGTSSISTTQQYEGKPNTENTPATEPTKSSQQEGKEKDETTGIPASKTENGKTSQVISSTIPLQQETGAVISILESHVQPTANGLKASNTTSNSIPQGRAPTIQNTTVPSDKPDITTRTRALIFSLETNINILKTWMSDFIDCKDINPSTSEDWRSEVENSSIVIFYSSSVSGNPIGSIEDYMEYSVSRKGHARVIVVIGNIQVTEDKVTSEWAKSRYSQCDLHVFTKTEWFLQDSRLQEMKSKVIQTRDSPRMTDINEENRSLQQSERIIFSQKSSETEGHWLETLLNNGGKADFRVIMFSKFKKLSHKVKKKRLSCCILHFKKNKFHKIINNDAGSPVIDKRLQDFFGKQRTTVIVVVDDLNDEESMNQLRELYNKTNFRQLAPLFLFRQEEKEIYLRSSKEAIMKAQDKWTKLQKSIEDGVKVSETCVSLASLPTGPKEEETNKKKNFNSVGIFSRSSNTDYSWMETMLKSPDPSLPLISGVRTFCITNNQFVQFLGELKLCTFGILYHTKNRGRVNVTDVTDSLYDEELETMSQLLGKHNVIVVIDDLPDNSLKEKYRILETQPKIKQYACDLLLVTEEEKKQENQGKEHLLERLRGALISRGNDNTVGAENPEPVPGQNIPSSPGTPIPVPDPGQSKDKDNKGETKKVEAEEKDGNPNNNSTNTNNDDANTNKQVISNGDSTGTPGKTNPNEVEKNKSAESNQVNPGKNDRDTKNEKSSEETESTFL
ncbi:uncharacterized protein RB166_015751 [Leptodactylus fuscus]|uniref:uncharacterized protein LOC142217442 n=1 Tax=Leptodactylus fuscus TaxID=238119 RepID=UPI003F4F2461